MEGLKMKRPRILTQLMIERRQRVALLLKRRGAARKYQIPPKERRLFCLTGIYPDIPRVSVKSLLRLAVRNRAFARSRWDSHDTETYSACGWDDYQLGKREVSYRAAQEYRRAARFLHAKGKP